MKAAKCGIVIREGWEPLIARDAQAVGAAKLNAKCLMSDSKNDLTPSTHSYVGSWSNSFH